MSEHGHNTDIGFNIREFLTGNQHTTMFSVGEHVEIKGFGKWAGRTFIGDIVQHCEDELYVVRLWYVIDPDDSDEWPEKLTGDDYCLQKQKQYRVVHQQFLREAEGREDGLHYNIGDIVDCEELCIMSRGTVIQKVIQSQGKDPDPNEKYTYVIRIDESGRDAHVSYYDIRPHMPWP